MKKCYRPSYCLNKAITKKNISFIINEWGMQLVQFVIRSKEHFMPNRNHIRSGNTKLIVFVTVKFVNVIRRHSYMCYFLEIVWNKKIYQTKNILFLVLFIFDNTNKSTAWKKLLNYNIQFSLVLPGLCKCIFMIMKN